MPSEGGTPAEGENLLERGFGEAESPEQQPTKEAPDATIARLKSIIDAWEQQQTEEAKRLLERSALVPPAASLESGGGQPKASTNTNSAAPATSP